MSSRVSLVMSRGRSALVEGREPLGEAARVALLGAGEHVEPFGDLLEPLIACGLGEAGVHLGELVGLALDGRSEVVDRGSHRHSGHGIADLGEEVEVAEGVTGLALRDGTEEGGDVGIPLDVSFLREVEVAAVGLALAGERLLQVGLGPAAFQLRHRAPCQGSWMREGTPAAAHAAHRPRKTTSARWTAKPCSASGGRYKPAKDNGKSRS